jgi:hypothetical protein
MCAAAVAHANSLPLSERLEHLAALELGVHEEVLSQQIDASLRIRQQVVIQGGEDTSAEHPTASMCQSGASDKHPMQHDGRGEHKAT